MFRPGRERAILVMIQFIIAAVFVIRGLRLESAWQTIVGLVAAALGVGLWFLQRWARFGSTALWVGIALAIAAGISSAWQVLGIIAFFVGGRRIWQAFSPMEVALHRARQWVTPDGGSMTSLVLLLRQPRNLNARLLANHVASAWGGHYDHRELSERPEFSLRRLFRTKNPERYVMGEKPGFFVLSPHGTFLVNCFDAPYYNAPDAMVAAIGAPRLHTILHENRGWISVDLMFAPDRRHRREDAYGPIAKLIVELAAADCIAVMRPETNHWAEWTDEIEAALSGPNPLAAFESVASPLESGIDEFDTRMLTAVEEARRRWPEFVESFKKHGGDPSTHFAIKAPVTADGRTEYFWITVDSIEDETVHGELDRDPVELGTLDMGAPVRVPAADILDWVYTVHGETTGMFTTRTLQKIQEGLGGPTPNEPHKAP